MLASKELVADGPLNYPQQEWFRGVEFESVDRGRDNQVIECSGPGDSHQQLIAALTTVIGEHETLRTTFDVRGPVRGEGLQHVHAAPSLEEVEAQVRNIEQLSELRYKNFSVADELPVEAFLGSDANGNSKLVLVMDHSLTDFYGGHVLRNAIEDLVRGEGSRVDDALQPLGLHHLEYKSTFPARRRLDQWKRTVDRMAHAQNAGSVQIVNRRGFTQQSDAATADVTLTSTDLARQTAFIARRARVSQAAVFLALFRVAQYGVCDISVYSPAVICANRGMPGADKGALKTYMPSYIHTEISPADTFRNVLVSSAGELLGAGERCHLPWLEAISYAEEHVPTAMDNFFNVVHVDRRSGAVPLVGQMRHFEQGPGHMNGRAVMISVFYTSELADVVLKHRVDLLPKDEAGQVILLMEKIAQAVVHEEALDLSMSSLVARGDAR